MIVVKLIGGLGNQMFQYAAARALALEKKQALQININSYKSYKIQNYSLNHFDIQASVYKKPNKVIAKLKHLFLSTTYYLENEFQFNPDFFSLKGRSILLEGFFQSEKYFLKYRKVLLDDFQIVSNLKSITKETITRMSQENSVSIHVRRGDYLQHEIHNTDKTIYYEQAIERIKSSINNPVFYLFSDDMNWVKENFHINGNVHYIDFNDDATNYEDMKLMSSCKHNIIANSSFSWWSAWLNTNPDKIVIAPKKWFNSEERNYSDVIPTAWIKL